MRAAVSFLFFILLFALIPSAPALNRDDTVPALTDKSKVVVVNAAQIVAVERRAEAGDPEAQFILGCAYRDGGPLLPQNQAEALKWFRKAADQGFARAENELGDRYLHGRDVPQDYTEAVRWFTKAAQHGDAVAAASLGHAYYAGQGVPRNYSYAFAWFSKAAEQGYIAAQYDLGLMYRHGAGVRRDCTEASKFLRAAAEKGLAESKCTSHDVFPRRRRGSKSRRGLPLVPGSGAAGQPGCPE